MKANTVTIDRDSLADILRVGLLSQHGALSAEMCLQHDFHDLLLEYVNRSSASVQDPVTQAAIRNKDIAAAVLAGLIQRIRDNNPKGFSPLTTEYSSKMAAVRLAVRELQTLSQAADVSPAFPVLAGMLNLRDGGRYIGKALAQLGAKQVLLEAAENPSARVAISALAGLEDLDYSDQIGAALVASLNHHECSVRARAVATCTGIMGAGIPTAKSWAAVVDSLNDRAKNDSDESTAEDARFAAAWARSGRNPRGADRGKDRPPDLPANYYTSDGAAPGAARVAPFGAAPGTEVFPEELKEQNRRVQDVPIVYPGGTASDAKTT